MAWWDFLQPASFNGVGFFVESTERGSGRRLVVNEFPLRDDPSQEDLGRLPRHFTLKAYFAGDDFISQRAALEDALENSSGVGTLVHPTYGILNVWVGEIKSTETRAAGSYAAIDISFSLDGGSASPLSITDTASTLLAALNSITVFIQAAYVASVGVTIVSAGVASLVNSVLGSLGLAFNAMPQNTIAGIVTGFGGDSTDSNATAGAILDAFGAAADNVLAAQPATPAVYDPIVGSAPNLVPAADPSGGLLALAGFGAGMTPAASALPALGVAQAALVTLIQGAALQAVLTVYGQLDWQSSNQAVAARGALQPLLDAQVAAAADTGDYDLFRAWRVISAKAMADLALRAQSLPSLATYSVAGVIPALALAQILYQDGGQADALVALNDVPHPIFMPPTGRYLQVAA